MDELKTILEAFFAWCDMLGIKDDDIQIRHYKKVYKELMENKI